MDEPTFEEILDRRRRERGEVARLSRAGVFVHDSQLLYVEDIGPDGIIRPPPIPENDYHNDAVKYTTKFFWRGRPCPPSI